MKTILLFKIPPRCFSMRIAGHPPSLTDASDTWLWYLLLPSPANSGIQHLVFHEVLISEEFFRTATLRTLSFLVIVFFKIISAGTHWTIITCLLSMLFNSSLRNKFLPSPDLRPSTLHFPLYLGLFSSFIYVLPQPRCRNHFPGA
jgi:hypothetical protein